MSIQLRWAPFPEADVVSYRVYRSIIGFKSPLVLLSTLNTKTLQLKIDGGATQTITFGLSGTLIDQINAVLTGAEAFLAASTTDFFVRSNTRESPGIVEIVGGSALSDLLQTARVITEKSEDLMIASVAALVDPTAVVSYADPDGVPQDWYRLSTISSLAVESLKSEYKQATSITGDICVIEGIVTNLQGVRIPDVEVTATLTTYPHSAETSTHVTKDPLQTLTNPDGRFSLALLQGATVKLEIPAVGYSHMITVPEKPFEFITNISVDLDYQLSEPPS